MDDEVSTDICNVHMDKIKKGSWLDDLIHVFNELGGRGRYNEVYPLAKARRMSRHASWTSHAEASIRRTVEDHAASSLNFKKKNPSSRIAVFRSVEGHGKGIWELLQEYRSTPASESADEKLPKPVKLKYHQGIEGIFEEKTYWRRSRDPRLVQARKKKDNFTCQTCSYRKRGEGNKYIIDVHHVMPLGNLTRETVTTLDDLVCLCPNCHRIAHSRKDRPLSVEEIKNLL
ncbi:HNH endonuclease [Komagataeibacter oboediens]|uniref:HNH endonuclease n=1 Tax=Komagataeibacter oboediens TaxID=65958 RepID=UPI001C2C8D83|nr:HNH endonuclease [Komagataeibacter oboediens]MBV0889998.1 HNH endonuclease [Komagataeibacter oboediens]MCK9818970.1 HNH endonuclease [Komagataeibacter oboediens]